MMKNDSAMLHAKWIIAQGTDRFRDLLNVETEDGQYNILIALLSGTAEQPQKNASL
jgi:hypothetical protein